MWLNHLSAYKIGIEPNSPPFTVLNADQFHIKNFKLFRAEEGGRPYLLEPRVSYQNKLNQGKGLNINYLVIIETLLVVLVQKMQFCITTIFPEKNRS